MLLAVLFDFLLGGFGPISSIPFGAILFRRLLLVTLVLLLVALVLLLLASDSSLRCEGVVDRGRGHIGLVDDEVSLGLARGRAAAELVVGSFLDLLALAALA